jgi:CheY-like chemotaxis protein
VLAVDDEEDARDVIASTLLARGATVRVVDSVAAAFAALRADLPDVIVTDISMAAVDGYGLVERLRASNDERWARIPVVALTAAASVQDRARALSSGFTSYDQAVRWSRPFGADSGSGAGTNAHRRGSSNPGWLTRRRLSAPRLA